MARFKGRVDVAGAGGRNPVLAVILGALLIILLVFVLWYVIDKAAFMAYWDSLGAAFRR